MPPVKTLALLMLMVFGSGIEAGPDPIRITVEDGPNPWTSLEPHNNPDFFQFAVVTDRTGGHRPGIFEDGVRKLNLLRPEFVMSVGDLIEGYSEDVHELASEWDEFTGFVDQLKMPFFYVPGNHDISNTVQARVWKERFGRSYYHFVYRNVLFLCLNSEDPPATQLSDEQIEYFRKTLEENPDVRWTLAFLHKPLWTYEGHAGWAKFEALLKGRKHTVFAGHNHDYVKYRRNDSNYIILATTGGGSELRGPVFGEFDHVIWVTMTDEGPVLANLLLEGIWDENIRTEEVAVAMQAVLEGRAVVCEPIRLDSPLLKAAVAKYRLTNDADVPMKVMLRVPSAYGIHSASESVERVVPPNSVEFANLRLEAPSAIPVEEVGAIQGNWTIQYEFEGHKPVEISGFRSCPVDGDYSIPPFIKPPKADGDLSDWGELTLTAHVPSQIDGRASAWTGREDCSFRFAVGADKQNFYVAVRVVDDEAQPDTGQDSRRRESVSLLLDARPDPARSQGHGREPFADYLLVVAPVGSSTGDLPDRDRLPAGVQAACVRTPKGFDCEFAIPAAYLDATQDGPWKALRMNIQVSDVDQDGRTRVWWRPEWGGSTNFEGSGTFRKQ
ncbi:MAG: metallophosphoesterase [Candidatus Omnitrophica bacterium]|nr:metallophosphoesterase [Candidatus Omnitrophota bacterium]